MEQMRKLPIGIQTFEEIRKDGYLYVDKTAWAYQIANIGKPYFLIRPRRFGKSLLLSTLSLFFRDFFSLQPDKIGLAICPIVNKQAKFLITQYIGTGKNVYTKGM